MLYALRQWRLKQQEALLLQSQALAELQNRVWDLKASRRKRLSTSKIVLWFMLILLLAIVIFTGYITISMLGLAAVIGVMDFTPLVALISAMVGQVIITLGYFVKSTKENTEHGLTYELAIRQSSQEEPEHEDIGGVG